MDPWGDWAEMFPKAKPKDEPAKTHLEVELTHKMRDALVALLEGTGAITEATKTILVRQLKAAREIDMPLYAMRLNWAELEAEAKRQGVSVVDVFWDRAGHRG